MNEVICPGLPGDWVNGWLAAIGATVLAPELRLQWTTEALPVAVLSARGANPVDVLVAAWPDSELIADLPIARDRKGKRGQDFGRLERNVHVDEYTKRVPAARECPYSWTLTSTMTDLCVERDGNVANAPFNPPAPRGLTLHDRLKKVHNCIKKTGESIPASLSGHGTRENVNGLGFDQTRIGSQADDAKKILTDPVVDVLAFFGLALLTVRGPADDARLKNIADTKVRQRGWRRDNGGGDSLRFCWPAWRDRLGRDAIDALLDVWNPGKRKTWSLYGVHAAWISVAFKPKSKSDTTRAFGAERLS